jgi:hypothetical protein
MTPRRTQDGRAAEFNQIGSLYASIPWQMNPLSEAFQMATDLLDALMIQFTREAVITRGI